MDLFLEFSLWKSQWNLLNALKFTSPKAEPCIFKDPSYQNRVSKPQMSWRNSEAFIATTTSSGVWEDVSPYSVGFFECWKFSLREDREFKQTFKLKFVNSHRRTLNQSSWSKQKRHQPRQQWATWKTKERLSERSPTESGECSVLWLPGTFSNQPRFKRSTTSSIQGDRKSNVTVYKDVKPRVDSRWTKPETQRLAKSSSSSSLLAPSTTALSKQPTVQSEFIHFEEWGIPEHVLIRFFF